MQLIPQMIKKKINKQNRKGKKHFTKPNGILFVKKTQVKTIN